MGRGLRKPAHAGDQAFAAEGSRLFHSLSHYQFCEGGTAGDGSDAPFGFEPDFSNTPGVHLQAKTQNVAAGRIFQLCRSVGTGKVAGIPRILEMIEQLRRIHTFKL